MKAVAKNKVTGTEYVWAEIIAHAPEITEVISQAGAKYLVRTRNLEFYMDRVIEREVENV